MMGFLMLGLGRLGWMLHGISAASIGGWVARMFGKDGDEHKEGVNMFVLVAMGFAVGVLASRGGWLRWLKR